MYGCDTLSLTLREEHRLWVCENRVLRTIFGPKRDTITGEWTKLYNEELNDLYSSPNIIRMIKSRRTCRAGHVARMGRGEVRTGFWRENLRERNYLEDAGVDGRIKLKMDLQEVGWGMDWIDLALDRDR
jgi:hypothetical protein